MKYINPRVRYSVINFFTDLKFRGSDRIANLTSNLLMPAPTGKLVIETIHGFKIKIDPVVDNGVERKLYRFGSYEKGTLNILNLFLREGDVFVDVGANIGLMTVYAATKVGSRGRVLSFEANPDTKRILDENVELNRLDNVTTFGFALGSAAGTSILYSNLSINRGSASLNKLDEQSQQYSIEIRRLDNVQEAKRDLKLMKVDVEGWELEVMKGSGSILSSPSAPGLVVECNTLTSSIGGKTSALYDFIKTVNSYKVFRLTHGKEKVSKLREIKTAKDLPAEDNLFCFLPDHIKMLPSNLFVK
ncbi:MAG: FkbM family methyltransferase [Chryseolinea sp.]